MNTDGSSNELEMKNFNRQVKLKTGHIEDSMDNTEKEALGLGEK
jgi:hypothetical protein